MRLIRARQGQSLAEYALLFALVIGAIFAMQNYISQRLKGTLQAYTGVYTGTADDLTVNNVPIVIGTFEPERTVTSTSQVGLTMSNVRSGTVGVTSNSTSVQTKQ